MNAAFTTFLIAVAFALSLGAMGQNVPTGHHPTDSVTTPQPAMTNGVVKRIDKSAGSLTIDHEPLTNLGMPGMTMTFLVKDRARLDGLKAGSPIRFVAENVKGELTIVTLEQAK